MTFDRRIILIVLVAALAVYPARLPADDAAPPPRDVLFNCPDPAVIQPAGGKDVYVFSTGRGIPYYRSEDLVHWKSAGTVFDRNAPEWAKAAIPNARNVWAPDIRWLNGRYYLYYAVSSFGSQRSVIGLAVNKTLDPASPDYRWEDRGLVIESAPGKTDFNAIDPAMFVDRDNSPYLFWGSFWSGIKAIKLDPNTGKPPEGPPKITAVAGRAKGIDPPAIEAPYVTFHEPYYYLFVSWDSCCDPQRATYKVVVGRAKSVLGPYVDQRGRPMSEGGGTLVLAGYGHWRGPGHNSALSTPKGDWLVNSGFDTNFLWRGRVLQFRRMYWLDDGWPVAGEALSEAVKSDAANAKPPSAAGKWTQWIDYDNKQTITLRPDGAIAAADRTGSWQQSGGSLVLRWKDAPNSSENAEDHVIFEAGGRSYVGRNARGEVVFGLREK
ncbi:MAG TPA: arabinan endo-1,5-alpha-L-arabinosidase [Pirellulales bacterium]|nr:arabinan endo-1,5-alpha-L-arabinosidase [Pirellulales bacterium]